MDVETPPIAGPRPIGQLAEVAIGAYTEIVDLIAPVQAAYGDLVTVEARVRNLHTTGIYIALTGRYVIDGEVIEIFPTEAYATVDPGATHSFYFSFSMPNNDVRFHVWSFFWAEPEWYQDDYRYVDIALGIAEVYAGTITRKELEYDEARASIPAYNIPQGKSGLVHIWGRNDMDTAQRMGIFWLVYDPDGLVVEEHSEWEAWPYTGPGVEHEFIGGRFNLDKVGTYTINAGLLMNPDDPVYVSFYNGTLCSVAAVVPEPEFAGFGITQYTKQ